MKHKKTTLLTLLFLTLAGCVSAPRYSEIKGRLPEIPSGQGRVFFYFNGMANPGIVRINKQEILKLGWGTFSFVDRPVGTYTLDTTNSVRAPASFSLESKKAVYVELSGLVERTGGDGVSSIRLTSAGIGVAVVPQQQAEKEMREYMQAPAK